MGKQGIGLRMQKNIMGKMGAKTVKAIIDEETSAMLDDVHDLWQLQTDEKTADKLLKNLIKIVVKLVLLLKNKQFNTDEIAMVAKAQNEFKKISMTIISFYEVIGSFDTEFLNNEFKDLHTCLETLLKPHLTEKSVGRLANVFGHLMKPGLMQKSFDPKNEKEYELVGSICAQLKKMVHENKF